MKTTMETIEIFSKFVCVEIRFFHVKIGKSPPPKKKNHLTPKLQKQT